VAPRRPRAWLRSCHTPARPASDRRRWLALDLFGVWSSS